MKSILSLFFVTLPSVFFPQVRIACVGDSITYGAGIENREQNSYPAKLQKLLGRDFEVRNYGRSGSRLSKGAPLSYWETQELKDALLFNPQVVIIMLGTNDCWPPRWEQNKKEFVSTFRDFVLLFRTLISAPTIYLCTPPPMFDDPASTASKQMQLEVVPLVLQAASETNCTVIDLNKTLLGKGHLFPDRLHPNASGAALIAEEVAETIAPYSEQKTNWKIVSVTSEEEGDGKAIYAIDGNPDTFWHSRWSNDPTKLPHELVVDTGGERLTTGFYCLPRQDGGINGRIRDFEFYGSLDGKFWELLSKGELKNESSRQRIDFSKSVTLRYFKLVALSECNGGQWTSVGEIDFRKSTP